MFELANLGEPPYDLIRLLGSNPLSIGIVVLHVRIFLHELGVLEIFRRCRDAISSLVSSGCGFH